MPRKNKKHSVEFKLQLLQEMKECKMGYRETERKYGLTHNVIPLWERMYLVEGAEGLMKERRGRTTKSCDTKAGRPPKLDKAVEEDLIAEVQRLRMENDYLKKLHALVQERIARESRKKPK